MSCFPIKCTECPCGDYELLFRAVLRSGFSRPEKPTLDFYSEIGYYDWNANIFYPEQPDYYKQFCDDQWGSIKDTGYYYYALCKSSDNLIVNGKYTDLWYAARETNATLASNFNLGDCDITSRKVNLWPAYGLDYYSGDIFPSESYENIYWTDQIHHDYFVTFDYPAVTIPQIKVSDELSYGAPCDDIIVNPFYPETKILDFGQEPLAAPVTRTVTQRIYTAAGVMVDEQTSDIILRELIKV
ncbi:MAG: hypothetical protein L3J71_03480 [Victivallaceae bacterium]|nr:hypothetical protein [Victivallaceae bacterium]